MNSEQLKEKTEKVRILLREFGRVIVAFSGGVDSTLLASLARDVLGKENALAVTANSASLAQSDLEEARRLACWLDLEHLVIQTQEVANLSYRANPSTRCYFCKQELFERLKLIALAKRVSTILYGAIGDDLLEERPGGAAALECGVRAPLQEVGFSKQEVREAARRLGLPNWDRPQNACLSSRIPHGLEVTEEKLRQIEQAEAVLREMDFRQVRVRHLGTHARVEVDRDEVARFDHPVIGREVAQRLKAIGFQSVGVVRSGYRPGGASHNSGNELKLV